MSDFRERDPYLQQRYGFRSHSRRWLVWAVFLGVIGGGWLMWAGWFHTHNSLSTSIIKYERISGQKLQVEFTFKIPNKGARYLCSFVALDSRSNVVGQVNVPLPVGPASGGSRVIIPTRTQAAAANIDSCVAQR